VDQVRLLASRPPLENTVQYTITVNDIERVMVLQAMDLLVKHYKEHEADGNLIDGAEIVRGRIRGALQPRS